MRTRGSRHCSRSAPAIRGRRPPSRCSISGRDPFTQKVFVNRGSAERHQCRRGGDRRTGRGRTGHARVSAHGRSDAASPTRTRRCPVRVERNGVRSVFFGAGAGRAARAALHGAHRGCPRRATGCVPRASTGPIRRVSRWRRSKRSSARPDRCSRRSPCGRWPAPIAAPICWCSARAPCCRRGPKRRSMPMRRRSRDARGQAQWLDFANLRPPSAWRAPARRDATPACVAGPPRARREPLVAEALMFARATAFTPARPEEILRPVNGWFILAHVLPRAAWQPGACVRHRRSRCKPDFLALVHPLLVHPGAALCRGGRRLDAGTHHGRGRRHAVRPARAGVRVARLRGRVLQAPRASLSRCGSRRRRSRCCCCFALRWSCWCASSDGAPMPGWTLPRAAARSERCCGRWYRCCCNGRSVPHARRRTCNPMIPTPDLPFTSTAAFAAVPRTARPKCAIPSASSSCSGVACSSRACSRCWPSGGSSRASSTCRSCSTSHYRTLAESNRIAIVPIVPNRGVITDRNGVVLAQSYSGVHAGAHARDRSATSTRPSTQLATIVEMQPRDRRRFRKLLDESKNFESLPLRTRLSDEEVARFAVNRYRFPGVEIKARLFRQYPYGELASHVIGYIGRINDHDLERIAGWDEATELQGLRLHRQGGSRAVLRARAARHDRRGGGRGRCRRACGAHVVADAAHCPATTCACRSTSSCRRWPRPRSATRRGALVAIDPTTGDILAFVSKPGYDPNLFVEGIDAANWEALNDSPDKPLLNRPLRGAYPPGSTIKPFLALGALTSGKRTPQQSISDPGFFQLPGSSHRFRDDKPGGHGTVDMYKSDRRVVRHVLLRTRERDRYRRQRALPVAAVVRSQDRRRHRGRADRRAALARMEAHALRGRQVSRGSTASGTSVTRSPPASGRATTTSRRCSWRRRSRRSPTTASRSGRTS